MTEPSTPGDRVGPYRLGRRLGSGGMGEVFDGFDERLDRPVALKRIRPQQDDEATRKRFRREAKAVARLSHSSIVQVHDWIEDESGAWIIMERVEGQSLRHLLQQPLPLPTALELAAEVAAGLAVAHRDGVVHRDLKPSNILVTRSGAAKILDFGLAKRDLPDAPESTLTVDGKIVGTVSAMSPEQALGRKVDARSDLFSFGSMLYEMVTGVAPFGRDSSVSTLTRICSTRQTPAVEVDPTIPRDLSQLIDALLEKDPAARPEGAAAVEEELRRCARRLKGERRSESGEFGERETTPGLAFEQTRASGLAAGPRTETMEESEGSPAPGPKRPWWPALVVPVIALWVVAGLFQLWTASGRTEVGSGPGDEATSGHRTLLEVDLDRLDSLELYRHGMALLSRYDKKGHIARAIEAFQRLLELEPDSASAHAGLARAYWRFSVSESKDADWLRQAHSVAERAVELGPFLAAARISRGLVFQAMGRNEEAGADLRAALELDTGSAPARIGLAKVLQSESALEEAEQVLLEGLALAPDSWSLHLNLGSLYYRTGRYENARASFETTIELAPDSILGYRNLSAALYASGDLAGASRNLQRALEIEPKFTLYSNLGTLYFAQGLYGQAVTAFEQALEQAGGANDYRAWANLADAYRWSPGREEESHEAYRRALQLLAEKAPVGAADPTHQSRRILYLAKSGDCAAVSSAARSLHVGTKDDASALYRLAVAREACGSRGPALDVLAEALRAGYSLEVVRSDPELRELRADPRYHRLLASRPG